MRTLAAAIAIALLLPAASQPDAGQGQATNIPAEEWTALASGRTLTYRINGEFWALEHYYPGTNHVTLQLYDGTCMQGTWDYTAPLYCFHWDGQGTSCFRHARRGDEILIIETHDGADTPMTQTMTAVTNVPLSCGPAVTS
jgi:hypothetical protein